MSSYDRRRWRSHVSELCPDTSKNLQALNTTKTKVTTKHLRLGESKEKLAFVINSWYLESNRGQKKSKKGWGEGGREG